MENEVKIPIFTLRGAHFSFLFPGIKIINPVTLKDLVEPTIRERTGIIIIDGTMPPKVFREVFETAFRIMKERESNTKLVIFHPPDPVPSGCPPIRHEAHLKELVDREKNKGA